MMNGTNAPLRRAASRSLWAAGMMLALVPLAASAQREQNPWPASYVPGTMGIPQPEPAVTAQIKNKSLNAVLYQIFQQVPLQYQVRAMVGTTVVSLDANKMPISKALQALLAQDTSQDPLVYSFQKNAAGGGTFVIDREFMELGEIEGENRVSLANARLTRVLPELFKLMKVKSRIEPDVPPILISLQLRPKTWNTVLPALILEADKQEPALTYSVDGDTVVVHLQKTPPMPSSAALAAGVSGRKVTLAVDKRPLRDVLTELFKGSTWRYQVSDAVKDVLVSYKVSDQFELMALQGVLRQAATGGSPITYREGKGVLYIEPGPLPGQVAALDERPKPAPSGKLVSLNISQRLKKIAEFLAQASGATIRVAPDVPDVQITVNIQNKSIEDALFAVIQASRSSLPNLTVRPTGHNSFELELGATGTNGMF